VGAAASAKAPTDQAGVRTAGNPTDSATNGQTPAHTAGSRVQPAALFRELPAVAKTARKIMIPDSFQGSKSIFPQRLIVGLTRQKHRHWVRPHIL